MIRMVILRHQTMMMSGNKKYIEACVLEAESYIIFLPFFFFLVSTHSIVVILINIVQCQVG